jgi:lipoprotein-anchoring transpeptidase ErfK/SrfK
MRARLLFTVAVAALLPAQVAWGSVTFEGGRVATAGPAPIAVASGPAKPIASQSGPISNERTTTYWAYSVQATPVRVAPNPTARVVGSTRLWTEDGFPEDYLVLAQEVYPDITWFQIRLPARPNGQTGWVPEQALSGLHLTHKLVVVDERHLRLTLYASGRKILSTPVGIGKPSTPTPKGHFWIREKFRVHNDPFYGPYAFGTADYSTLSEWPHGGVVGIHGTNKPQLIPGRPSHGCIRMRNPDITRLWSLLPVGTPIRVI